MKSVVALFLTCALATPSLAAAQPAGVWRKVHQLAPGNRLTVTRRGGPPHSARFIHADDTELKLLNVSDATMPPGAARALIRMASDHPNELTSVTPGSTLRIRDDVVLSASGLFDGNRKVADYDRVIESISRTDVETGVVWLEIPHRMAMSEQVLLTAAIAAASPLIIMVISCARGCK
jgi:hypothetical protein